MIALAVATGIPPTVWAEEGERSIATAIDLLERERQRQEDGGPDDGPQMSG